MIFFYTTVEYERIIGYTKILRQYWGFFDWTHIICNYKHKTFTPLALVSISRPRKSKLRHHYQRHYILDRPFTRTVAVVTNDVRERLNGKKRMIIGTLFWSSFHPDRRKSNNVRKRLNQGGEKKKTPARKPLWPPAQEVKGHRRHWGKATTWQGEESRYSEQQHGDERRTSLQRTILSRRKESDNKIEQQYLRQSINNKYNMGKILLFNVN